MRCKSFLCLYRYVTFRLLVTTQEPRLEATVCTPEEVVRIDCVHACVLSGPSSLILIRMPPTLASVLL